MARLVFAGTPEVAVVALMALVEAGHDIALVVTRTDTRRGRGSASSPSPVKAAALDLGLRVGHDIREATGVGAELGVVVAYGRIIPTSVLDAVPMVNVHFSLLPRWRGAAPVERAILAGDARTGVCIMEVAPELDTGGIYAAESVEVGPDEHLAVLRARLGVLGAGLLVDVLAQPLGRPNPQAGEPTYADKIRPDELELVWARPAADLQRVVRLDRAWTTFRSRRLVVLESRIVADVGAQPGALVGARVQTGAGSLELVRVQPAGRRPMAAADWVRGLHLGTEVILG